jgi:acyl-CoA thioester hydrolase
MRFAYTHRIEVRFRDCDAMGHVNNAVFFTYLEQARVVYVQREDYLRELGGAGFIVARAECDFKTPILFGELIDVRMRVASIGRSSFAYEYEIVKVGDGSVAAVGKSVQVVFDYRVGRSIEIPSGLRARLERAMANE